MKKFLFLSFLILLFSNSFATHISGGEMSYVYLGPGSTPGTLKYRVTLRMYKDCNTGGAQLEDVVTFTVFNSATNAQFLNITGISGSQLITLQKTATNPCVPDAIEERVCFLTRTYSTIIDNLPVTSAGYTVTYQRCCRVAGMENINSTSVGTTYFAKIPGNSIPGAQTNSSPLFNTKDTVLICSGRIFTFDFGAADPDNDVLVYSFYNAFTGGGPTTNPSNCTSCTSPDPAASPPYAPVTYINGYAPSSPLGSLVTINTVNGIISGVAPNLGPGANSIFAITVLVSEYRGNVKIGEHYKDLQIRIVDCQSTSALLLPKPTTCDGNTVYFKNDAPNNPPPAYLWDFGDPASGGNNTSNLPEPSHFYATPGIYTVKLVLNQGDPCGDSTTTIVKVFPGFSPDFEALGKCKNTPIQFNDLTTAAFGVVDNWKWNFGEPISPTNTSTLKNPTHTYASANTYNVEFIVSTSVGCIDTVYKTIDILDQPPLSVLPKDTLICVIDTLQLNALGTGSFTWSPNYMINNINAPSPLVSPDVTTTYRVTITDPFGCAGSDTVRVRVVNNVTQFAGPDTSICRTDPVVLQLTSDALRYVWTENPAGNTLNNPFIKNPTATPLVTTTYHVVSNIGKCIAEDDIVVTPVPYPAANAGPDNTICFGNSAQLSASGGSIYSWSPAAFLTATNIPNPVSVKPTDNVRYIVTVRDVLGCPKPVKDTVFLFVAKIKANAGPRDTSVVLDQPLQLFATGSINYSWTPTTWLNNPNISNPIALPRNDIEYIVRVSNNAGCFDFDSIRVRVFKIKPDLLVPNAFTPNGDGNNDIFKPILIGMKSLDVFMVYNRWGQMLYSGSGNDAAWDGTFGGRKQETATYVWYAEGVDYLNKKIKRKGSVILIR
jgi:gliding motility-associated-like protein